MMMIDVLQPLLGTWNTKWVERPPKIMQLACSTGVNCLILDCSDNAPKAVTKNI